jgi:hypothetical protein
VEIMLEVFLSTNRSSLEFRKHSGKILELLEQFGNFPGFIQQLSITLEIIEAFLILPYTDPEHTIDQVMGL